MSEIRLNPETCRLTAITGGEKHPLVCQSCGGSNVGGFGNGLMRLTLSRWQECDHNDRPENKVLVLCDKCSKRIIEPHPRLYHQLHANQPWPGCMAICVNCRLREGVTCKSPDAKANGGSGVLIGGMGELMRGFVDYQKKGGGRGGHAFAEWSHAPTSCKQKEMI